MFTMERLSWPLEPSGTNAQKPRRSGAFGATFVRAYAETAGLGGDDVDEAALLALVLELHDAGDLGVEGVVGAAADVEAGLVRCAALADEDAAAGDGFAVAALDAEPLGV
jgi:hypothetical protein